MLKTMGHNKTASQEEESFEEGKSFEGVVGVDVYKDEAALTFAGGSEIHIKEKFVHADILPDVGMGISVSLIKNGFTLEASSGYEEYTFTVTEKADEWGNAFLEISRQK